MAPGRADSNSEAICKARHQVVFTNGGSNVASRVEPSREDTRLALRVLDDILCLPRVNRHPVTTNKPTT